MSKLKHLLFIVSTLIAGGAEKHTISLLNHLNKDKFRLSLAYLKDKEEILDEVDTSRLNHIFKCNVSHKIDYTAVTKIARFIEEQQVDVVVCTNQYPMLYGLLAKWKAVYPCKVVEIFHTTLLNGLKDNLQWIFYKHVFKRCDHIVFVSENQSKYWLENRSMNLRRNSVIQNGIEVEKFTEYSLPQEERKTLLKKHGIQLHELLIGICAALRPEKKHTDLIQAVNQLRSKGVDAGLLIIGDGEERQKIEDNVAAIPSLEQSVYFVGFQKDVRLFGELCHCMVIASHSIETFSISALESMAMGKPMIMTDIGGASEQITHGQSGFLYPAGDIDSLVRYLKELEDPVRRKAMGAMARKTVIDKFTMTAMINKYETLFVEGV